MKGTKIDVLLDPPQVCGSTDLQVGEFQVTIPGGVCPTDRAAEPFNVAIGGNVAHQRECVMGSGELTDPQFLDFNQKWMDAVLPYLVD